MNKENPTRSLAARRQDARVDAGATYVERRTEIIAAARDVFRKKGFHAATFKDIADAYGGDRATVYYYFKNKRELFREIVLHHIERNVTRAEALASEAHLDPVEKVRAIIVDLMESYQETYPDLYIYIQEDMGKLLTEQSDWADDIRELQRRYDRTVEQIIVNGIKEGVFVAPRGPRLAAYAIIGMLNWTHRWYYPEYGDATDIGEGLADLVLGGLQARTGDVG